MLAIILIIKYLDSKRLLKFILSLFCFAYVVFTYNLILNFKRCPECYGTELCHFFENHQIRLTWFSYLLALLNPGITKSVFHGTFNTSLEIVIKGKARRKKFNPFLTYDFKDIKNDVILNADKIQNVILCPGFRNIDFLFMNLKNEINNHRLWLDLKTSIEPLLLMFLWSHGEWPIPRSYGFCGDLNVQEYKGKPLGDFISVEWEERAFIGFQLLNIAEIFTFKHPEFAFYLTDFSMDNVVVDSSGNVTLIDLDNIIIFDKVYSKGMKFVKNSIHNTSVFSQHEYSFSPSDICSHYLSDHNYFTVCKFLLLDPEYGLFKDIPPKVAENNSELLHMLGECDEPKSMGNRIMAGQMLKSILQKSIINSKWKF